LAALNAAIAERAAQDKTPTSDIQQAVADGATVPIYDESRLAQLDLAKGEEIERKEKLKSKWAQMEALVGAPQRIDQIAADLVRHFEQRGKALAQRFRDPADPADPLQIVIVRDM